MTHPAIQDGSGDSRQGTQGATGFLALVLPLILIELNSSFEVSMLYAVLPELNRSMGDLGNLSWILTANSLAAAASCLLSARLGDMFGRRRMLVVIPLICATGSLVSATATNLWGVVVGAAIQGLTSGMLPIAFAIARDRLPSEKAALGIGLITASLSIGTSLGITLGGFIADILGWQAIFYFSASLAVCGTLIARYALPCDDRLVRSPVTPRAMIVGSIFAPAIAFLIIGVNGIGLWGGDDEKTLSAIILGVASLMLWARHQLHTENPLVNLRMLGRTKVLLSLASMSLLALGPMQYMQVMPLFLQQPTDHGGFGQSSSATGLLVLPSLLIGLIGAPLSGWVVGRSNAHQASLCGLAILALGWVGLGLASDSLVTVVAFLMLAQAGFYFTYAALPNLVMEGVPRQNAGEAASTLSVVRAVFAAIGAQIVGVLLARNAITTAPGHYIPAMSGYLSAFVYFAVVPLIGAAILLIRGQHRTVSTNDAPDKDDGSGGIE